MSNKIIFIVVTAVLFLNACDGKMEASCRGCIDDNETNVTLLNKELLKEQIKAIDNGYCQLLPYPFDPRMGQGNSMSVSIPVFLSCKSREKEEAKANSLKDSILPDGKPYLNSMPNFSYCDNLDKTESDSLQKIYDAWLEESESLQETIDAWQEEVWKVRRDPTRTATLTLSKEQTIIALSPIFIEVDLDVVRLRDNKKSDTLYIEAVSGRNGSYARMTGMNNCPISLDIALNYIDENIKVIVFEEEQIFQVRHQ
jgi:hypothetical protein